MSFWDILHKFELVCQTLSYEAEIRTMSSLYQDKKVDSNLWKIFLTLDFVLLLHDKSIIFQLFLAFFI